MLCLWYYDSMLNTVFWFLRSFQRQQRMKKITDIGWESKEQENRKAKENYCLFWWSDTKRYFHYYFLQQELLFTLWKFSTVWHLLVYSLNIVFCTTSWQCWWALALTYLQIKASIQWHQHCHCLQSIHLILVEWLMATLSGSCPLRLTLKW